MATIPMDIIHSCILPRLSVKTLTRFKSVSKSWQTIISSPEFIRLHHKHTLSSDTNRLIVFMKDLIFHVHELDSPLVPSLHWRNYPEHPPIVILASSEFFLLINFLNIGLVLLNPSIGKYYKIPNPPDCISEARYGMYLDDANNDYKILIITHRFCFPRSGIIETSMDVTVYSLRTNMWRSIEPSLDNWYDLQRNGSAIIRHLLHILLVPSCHAHYLNTNNVKKRIGCFDILAERWTNDVPFPQLTDLKSINLSVLDGLLCVTALNKEETGCGNYSVWVMKEYGVKDSWFKLMSIASDDIFDLDFNPIAFRKGSRHEVLCRRNSKLEYIWYNVREKKATTATINGVIPKATYGYICKGSLVDFPGGRNMKLHQPKQAKGVFVD